MWITGREVSLMVPSEFQVNQGYTVKLPQSNRFYLMPTYLFILALVLVIWRQGLSV